MPPGVALRLLAVAAVLVASATGCGSAEPAADRSWRMLPVAHGTGGKGYSSLQAVRVGRRAVFVAGASYRVDTVDALSLDLRTLRWSAPVRAPLRWRAGQSVVAAGHEAIVWGGASNTGSLADGAAFDPAERRWRMLPAAPLRARSRHAAVWTGSEMVVWGGTRRRPQSDGAAYRPATGRWRRLARAPLRPRSGHVAVWTGRAMLVWGGQIDRPPPAWRVADLGRLLPPLPVLQRRGDLRPLASGP